MSTPRNARREQLLDDLVALFLAQGFSAFTLSDLARRLHCSKSTLYGLGHSKEQVTVNALVHFFRRATARVEERTEREDDPDARIVTYLRAVADELRPASSRFMDDLAGHPATRTVYERNTRIAADRVCALVADGAARGAFRAVDPGFVADVVAATMARIQRGELARTTGLTDAQAYDELAGLVLNGISERTTAWVPSA